jgi:asparagine synthase (glutamine-hydrolysing)
VCGFAGCVENGARSSAETLRATAGAMVRTLAHRGPDDEGVWLDATAGVALGSRRLAIVDLSPAGHQPMISESGRYVLAYNGEIYNAEELRAALQRDGDIRFRGHSDTEVLLAAVEKWGLQVALERLNGMFAFALWDRERRELSLARDRMGEKPLYYGWAGNSFLFASELKAMQAHPSFAPEIDRVALVLYMQHSCVPAPYSIYQGIRKLPPASYALLRLEAGREPVVRTYWTLRAVAVAGAGRRFAGNEKDAAEQLEALLRDSVRKRMIADVPLGAFLSGGIDSSTIVALMQQESSRAVKTFAVGTRHEGFNEAQHAAAVAQHLHTDHTELYVTPEQAREVIPTLPRIYDEPFADSSQIPTYLVAKLARQHVTVSLSGDGGDEVFGGYNRHVWTRRLWKRIAWMPRALRGGVGRMLASVPEDRWEMIAGALGMLSKDAKQRMPGHKVHKLAGALHAKDLPELYLRLATHWQEPVVVGAESSPAQSANGGPALPDFVEQMMYLDSVTYLPDDILVKLDRATMATSLEGRVPFLDHRLVEFAWSLPLTMKVRGRTGKRILREILYKHVPRELVERPKMGFGLPIGDWLRGPLRDWAEALLNEKRLREGGYLEPALVRKKWQQHLAGEGSWAYHLWDVLMFQAWHAEYTQASDGRTAAVRLS